jgi:4-carboxymuconolactone decarboxylase
MQLQPRISASADVPPGLPPLNIFRTIARNEPLAKGFLSLGGRLLRGEGVPAREREIVILRAGWRGQSEYEFGQHTSIGRAAGLTDAEVAALADAGDGGWSGDDKALIAMVDELCEDDVVSDATWSRLEERWSAEELLELLVLAGYYRLVCGLLNSAGVALEPGTPGWPDGAAARLEAPRETAR